MSDIKKDYQIRPYFAVTGTQQIALLKEQGVKDILISYAHIQKKGVPDILKNCHVMLDSGAYSNIKNPGSVTLEPYMEFLKSERKKVAEYVALDVVHNQKQTSKNYEKMLKEGFNPIFVDQLCSPGGLDGTTKWAYKSGKKICWAGFVMPYNHRINAKKRLTPGVNDGVLSVCAERFNLVDAFPKTKLHLLGIGTRGRRFVPFWRQVESIDAASWIIRPQAFGQVLHLNRNKEGWPSLSTSHYDSPSQEARQIAGRYGWNLREVAGRVRLSIHEYKRYFRALESRMKQAIAEYKAEDNVDKSVSVSVPDTLTDDSKSVHDIAITLPIHKVDDDQRLITGIVLEPEEIDAQNDIISVNEIQDAAFRFLSKYNKDTKLGLMHKIFENIGVVLVESWIAKEDDTVNKKPVKKGSWLMTVKVLEDGLWKKVKDGSITGFSIGGVARVS